MHFIDTQRTGQTADGSSQAMHRLQVENKRLNALCAMHEMVATRHELLRRESDHRIKNSLQVVASLLAVQARRETSVTTRQALRLATSRLHAVAHLHDAIQFSTEAGDVDLGALLTNMGQSLQAMAGDQDMAEIVVSAAAIPAPVQFAKPIVLAVNELVLNALRHAFPAGRKGRVMVEARVCGSELRVSVHDDGVGLPAEIGAVGYGTVLVKAIIANIGGRLDIQDIGGTRITLSARLPAPPIHLVSSNQRSC